MLHRGFRRRSRWAHQAGVTPPRQEQDQPSEGRPTPICADSTVPDPRKVFANQVVHDQMQRNADAPASGPLTSVVNQVGKELDQLGEQISKLQGELAEVRKLLNSA